MRNTAHRILKALCLTAGLLAVQVAFAAPEPVRAEGVTTDSDGPEIVTLSVSEATVAPGDTFTITAQVQDGAEVQSAGFYFTLDGAQRDFCGQGLQLTGGDANAGTWTHECVVPADVQGGDYTIVPYAQDAVGNYTNTNCCSSSDTRAYFSVDGGTTDSDGPEIVALSVSEATVAPGDTFTITAQVQDGSGVDHAAFSFRLDGAQRDFCGQGPLQLTGGDDTDGTWTYDCVVPDDVQGGDYTVKPYARDAVGNWTNTNCCSSSDTRAYFTVADGDAGEPEPTAEPTAEPTPTTTDTTAPTPEPATDDGGDTEPPSITASPLPVAITLTPSDSAPSLPVTTTFETRDVIVGGPEEFSLADLVCALWRLKTRTRIICIS